MRVSFNCLHVIMLSPKAESHSTLKGEANKSERGAGWNQRLHTLHISSNIFDSKVIYYISATSGFKQLNFVNETVKSTLRLGKTSRLNIHEKLPLKIK